MKIDPLALVQAIERYLVVRGASSHVEAFPSRTFMMRRDGSNNVK